MENQFVNLCNVQHYKLHYSDTHADVTNWY